MYLGMYEYSIGRKVVREKVQSRWISLPSPSVCGGYQSFYVVERRCETACGFRQKRDLLGFLIAEREVRRGHWWRMMTELKTKLEIGGALLRRFLIACAKTVRCAAAALYRCLSGHCLPVEEVDFVEDFEHARPRT